MICAEQRREGVFPDLVSRHGLALDGLFPELAEIGDLPPGTLLDGELVVLRQGPDLSLVQSRHQLPAFVLLATLSASESVDCRIKRTSF